jgi:hypothetical protein
MSTPTATAIGWNTSKHTDGYTWRVYSAGYQVQTTILATGTCATREKATIKAKAEALRQRRARGTSSPLAAYWAGSASASVAATVATGDAITLKTKGA